MRSITGLARRHVRPLVGAGVAAAVLAAGGIAYAASDGGATPAVSAPISAATSAATKGSATPASRKARLRIARGTVTAIDGSTWTVRTARGVSITVTITKNTRFGTKASPESAASFHIGSSVTIVGRRTGSTSVAARRIRTPKDASTTGA